MGTEGDEHRINAILSSCILSGLSDIALLAKLAIVHKALSSVPCAMRYINQLWWYTPITSALGQQKKEDQEFKVIPGHL